ncbi:hypothetical protein FH972_024659 [Carpinus fangiana]|uniref:Uncharacterized protein n=1 Tax=Carpinus fangiana TaxID=176857 RepID=A0A5N6KZI9_9ROSI|nr:hypothetical protein FH972_024659 [Carpinus fangiana]
MMSQTFPTSADYTPLSEHESSTPSTFFGGKAVLHEHQIECQVLVTLSEFPALAEFGTLAGSTPKATNGNSNGNGESTHHEEQSICDKVDVFVNSHDLTLANRQGEDAKILRIPYPAISLHASQRLYLSSSGSYTTTPSESSKEPIHAVYLQLDPSYATRDQTNPDIEDISADATLLIVPPPFAGIQGQSNSEAAQAIFEALGRCADLHPDPDADSDAEGDGQGGSMTILGEGSLPGAGGWITAENAHEFEDEFADPDETGLEGPTVEEDLGPRVGSKREGDDPDDGGDDGKWQRTC